MKVRGAIQHAVVYTAISGTSSHSNKLPQQNNFSSWFQRPGQKLNQGGLHHGSQRAERENISDLVGFLVFIILSRIAA